MASILEHEAPAVVSKLRALTPAKRRAALAAACAFVAPSMNGLQDSVRQLLGSIENDGDLRAEDLLIAQELAERADNEYLDLDQSGDKDAALARFHEARFLTAVATGFGNASTLDSEDAVYELSRACDDPSIVLDFILALGD